MVLTYTTVLKTCTVLSYSGGHEICRLVPPTLRCMFYWVIAVQDFGVNSFIPVLGYVAVADGAVEAFIHMAHLLFPAVTVGCNCL